MKTISKINYFLTILIIVGFCLFCFQNTIKTIHSKFVCIEVNMDDETENEDFKKDCGNDYLISENNEIILDQYFESIELKGNDQSIYFSFIQKILVPPPRS